MESTSHMTAVPLAFSLECLLISNDRVIHTDEPDFTRSGGMSSVRLAVLREDRIIQSNVSITLLHAQSVFLSLETRL